MIVYETSYGGETNTFHSNKKEAIAAAKELGGEFSTVDELILPKLSKALLISALNQRGFVISRRQVWPPNK